ncbi:TRAP transporter substrate-binding protein [Anaerobacillus isosaccharinicus]|uniref:TRAP transporter substrate-binding protein n=1 Tax=Anaerobacillus isosaccharinicus TaxID=1532552 RepID=A0A1S2M7M5_9BACI|nr:TRAP transporter substrate-binding protein [Anaerobacillus isosaccharinicus]MBA5585020.1 TRAP transporter substrate-binding protein [Anaerobacillus isosaccharinicus]QOY36628.1 TRAP transporter substrate-binding protein [Anaerobacillus isosaccharinicus]
MFKSKKLLICVIALIGILLAACSSSDSASKGSETKEFRLGMVAAQNSIQHQAAEKFAEVVNEKTNGEINISVFPAGQIGSDESLGQDLSRGNLEFAFINQGSLSGMNQLLDFHYLPYIVSNYEEADELFYGDGIIPQTMRETLSEHGIKALGWYELEFRGLSNSVRSVQTPADMEGLRLRVPGSQAIMGFFNAVGSQTVTIAMPELYTSLQQGTVDGQDNGLLITYDNKLHEPNQYYTRLNHVFATSTIAMSEDVWKTLSEETQEILVAAAKEAQDWQIAEQRKETENYVQKMKGEGVEVIELTPGQIAEFQAIGMEVWESLTDIYGSERIQKLIDEVEEIRNR